MKFNSWWLWCTNVGGSQEQERNVAENFEENIEESDNWYVMANDVGGEDRRP